MRRNYKIGRSKNAMGRMCVVGHQNFGRKKLEECGIEQRRIVSNSEEGHGPYKAVVPMLMMIMTYISFNPFRICHEIVYPPLIFPMRAACPLNLTF
jgi:hypothetical protein